jgi:hypothetical protein
MLKRGDSVAHFVVTRTDGTRVDYATIWQRKNLLLVLLPAEESDAFAEYGVRLDGRRSELTSYGTEVVITRNDVPSLESPAVVVADRWGEVFLAVTSAAVTGLPDPDELAEWLRFVQSQCPECEGESR